MQSGDFTSLRGYRWCRDEEKLQPQNAFRLAQTAKKLGDFEDGDFNLVFGVGLAVFGFVTTDEND
jgi:hypothetical protein